ncbi:MAG: hypothetical protein U1D31_00150 [Patescibacteria group bacterium]|nr:hypothetical protein [bacterium]MDZ4240531.1 hypothetical protein [Patescibacteria group bacterium]
MTRLFFLLLALISPVSSFGQSPLGPDNFDDVVSLLIGIMGLLYPALVALALLVFFWGLAKFMSGGGNEQSVEDGKKLMLWGIIGLFVLVSMWGIVRILVDSFGFDGGFPLAPEF